MLTNTAMYKDTNSRPAFLREYFDGDLIIAGSVNNGSAICGLFMSEIIVDGDIIFDCNFSTARKFMHIYVMHRIECSGQIIMPSVMLDIFDYRRVGDNDNSVYAIYQDVNQRVKNLTKPLMVSDEDVIKWLRQR